MPVSQAEYEDAARQIISHCKLRSEQSYYDGLCVRGILYELGYNEDDTNSIIKLIAEGGFNYCLDRTIAAERYDMNNEKMVKEFPSQDVCYWGDPMQIASRMYGLSNCPNAKLYNLR